MLNEPIDRFDADQALRDVAPFIKDQQMIANWFHDFFRDVARRIQIV